MSDTKTFGQRYQQCRLEKGITLQSIANKTGLTPDQLRAIEASDADPERTTVELLVNAFSDALGKPATPAYRKYLMGENEKTFEEKLDKATCFDLVRTYGTAEFERFAEEFNAGLTMRNYTNHENLQPVDIIHSLLRKMSAEVRDAIKTARSEHGMTPGMLTQRVADALGLDARKIANLDEKLSTHVVSAFLRSTTLTRNSDMPEKIADAMMLDRLNAKEEYLKAIEGLAKEAPAPRHDPTNSTPASNGRAKSGASVPEKAGVRR